MRAALWEGSKHTSAQILDAAACCVAFVKVPSRLPASQASKEDRAQRSTL